jgi:adenylate kinase
VHVNLSEMVKERGLHDGFDEKFQSYIINDDKVCDELEGMMEQGGVVLDTHSLINYFPERWFHLVIVLATDNTILFDRLTQRKYSPAKVEENVQCEIMMVVAQEAQESYTQIPVQVLQSNTVEELESNVSNICAWVEAWINNNNE